MRAMLVFAMMLGAAWCAWGGLVPRLLILEAASVKGQDPTAPWTVYGTYPAGTVVTGSKHCEGAEGTVWKFGVYDYLGITQNVTFALRFRGMDWTGEVGSAKVEGIFRPYTDGAVTCTLATVYQVRDAFSAPDRAPTSYPDAAILEWKFLIFWEWEGEPDGSSGALSPVSEK